MHTMIAESDLDGENIRSKMLNILKNTVIDENDQPTLVTSTELENAFFFYRKEVIKMIQNNKTTLKVNYSHINYIDSELAEVLYFFFYKVFLTSTRNSSTMP